MKLRIWTGELARAGATVLAHPAFLPFFDGLVSVHVEEPEERRRQALAMLVLVGLGLLSVSLSPLAMVSGLGLGVTLAVSVLAFLCLVAATVLAATGELDVVVAGAYTLAGVALGLVSLEVDTLWPMAALVAGPVEAYLAKRQLLFRLMVPTVFAAIGLMGFVSLHGIGPAARGFAGWSIALPILAVYGAFVLLRRWTARGFALQTETPFVRLDPSGLEIGSSLTMPGFADIAARPHFRDRLHLLDRVAFLKAMDELRFGRDEATLDLRLRTDAAAEFEPLTLRLVAVRSGETLQEIHGFRASLQRSEAELGEALAEAREASRAKTEFLTTVSHELRTPLNAIIGFSDLLDQEFFGSFSDPRQKEYVGLIRQSGAHLLEIVNSLLDVSKIEAGRYELNPEPFDARDVATAACEMVRTSAEAKGLRLLPDTGRERIGIVADRRACRQILVNLLSNAVKFTDQGIVSISVSSEDGQLVFVVADTGIGIEAQEIDRLGHPFVQVSKGLSRRYEGTGLGLSVVKGLCELHHGTMQIRSEPDRGTVVTIRIPLDCAERIRSEGHPSENVVAITDARKKNAAPQTSSERRSA